MSQRMETLARGVQICPNLEAGINIGNYWITIDYAKNQTLDGQIHYRWTIIFPDNSEVSGDDLRSGCHVRAGRSTGLESLLSFLGAAAESYQYETRTGRKDENTDLFPRRVVEFAAQYSDEIAIAQIELEETLAESDD